MKEAKEIPTYKPDGPFTGFLARHDWNAVKQMGSEHYKTGGVEPIDLYKEGKMLQDFAVANIIKYAYRNRRELGILSLKDLGKIEHFVAMLKVLAEEAEHESV